MSRSRNVEICFLALATALALDVGAAQTPDTDPPDPSVTVNPIEEIVVTGSRIKRRDFITPSPVITINRADIAFSGQATLEEALQRMPQVVPYYGRTSNNPPGDEALVNLRGLGPGRSLTLLNGRRIAGSGAGNSVNLNNIPQFLVERVEIISGGTSAVYGSDAIAGVINFITRDDFEGVGVEASMSAAEPGDAESYDVNLAWGHNFANGRGNLTVYLNDFERKALYAGDRAFTAAPYKDDRNGSLVEAGSTSTPAGHILWPYADLGNGPVSVTFNDDGTPREFVFENDKYNYAPVNYLQVPINRRVLGLQGNYDLQGNIEGYIEASFVRNEPSFNVAPVPPTLFVGVNLDNPLLAPETRQLFTNSYGCDPGFACIYIGKRLTELGPRIADFEQEQTRVLAGLRGEIGVDWTFDGWVTYTISDGKQYIRNLASPPRFQQGLLVDPLTSQCIDPSGGCVPLDIFGAGRLSDEAAEFVRVPSLVNRTKRTSKLASAFITGAPFETPAGPVGMAFGLEWRSDDVRFSVDEGLTSADVFGWNPLTPVAGRDEVFEIYTESTIPLANQRAWMEYIGIEIGARYSSHEHAGSVWTYKAGAEWKLTDSLGFRAMFQRSARAPNSRELFAEQEIHEGWLALADPCSASQDPVANGFVDKCILQGLPEDQVGLFEATNYYPVDTLTGGNPQLVPEVAETWTAGIVVSPENLPNWTLSVDHFSLDVQKTIGWVDAMYFCFDSLNIEHLFCEKISRDDTGNVRRISELIENRGYRKTSGFDTAIRYAGELPGFLALGRHSPDIVVSLYWTHVDSHEEQEHVVAKSNECAGYFGWICGNAALPADRVAANLHYASGPVGLHASWRWIAGSRNAYYLVAENLGRPVPNMAIPEIGDKHYTDIGLSYAFGDAVTARLGVNNLFDNDPPMMADAVNSNNTDTGLYDVFGRSYHLTLFAQF